MSQAATTNPAVIQRFSRGLFPTVKETPADATNASHKLLLRGGFVRQVGAGIYNFLPLGLRVLRKIENVVRQEMDRAGAQEVLMPALLPADYFRETGRWDLYGDVLLRVRDRKGGDYHLGPTHEEIVTDMVRREVRSYRQLPLNLYQIQTKFRDEPRPRGGIMRGREFTMKDAYSFDVDEAGAQASYERMREAYKRIFTRLGLTFRVVQADSGAIGGKTSAEFQILADSGEDAIVACTSCDYAANVEAAEVAAPASATDEGKAPITKVHTPGKGSITEVAAFLGRSADKFVKSLLYVAVRAAEGGAKSTEVVMVCVRGDHDVNEIKLANALSALEVHLATEADVVKATGAKVGYAGPVGFAGKVLVDRHAAVVVDGITGANETDQHLTGVNFARGDYRGEVVDLRQAAAGDDCPRCGQKGGFKAYKGIEGGHIFILGTHYSSKMGCTFVDEKGAEKPIVMGCYGIGVSRLVASTVEQHHDQDGIRWPMSIAPYHVYLATLANDEATIAAGQALAEQLAAQGLEVLWDDRDERPGVKFKDADLLGVPVRVTIGKKTLEQKACEIKLRSAADPKAFEVVPLAAAADKIVSIVSGI
ncbi:MAG: proline--tRNA ligase [Polyangiaceae bacterium]